MNEWDERSEYYRDSPAHGEGDDHVAEPDGSAWTDVKWAAQAVKRA